MAAFDFPSSPTTGQVFTQNGVTFVWNGYAWIGNAQQAGPQTEQLFDLSGKATLDIAVPSWAKAAALEISAFPPNGAYIGMRLSADGTTFFSGASDYRLVGPQHFTGTAAFTKADVTPVTEIQLSLVSQDAAIATSVTAQLSVSRASTALTFGLKNYSKTFGLATTQLFSTWWGHQYLMPAVTTALTIKALRIYSSTGTFGAGSWVQVNWIGDSAAIPTGNAIADAPQDNGEYVRVNGIWRLKAQTLVLDGLAQVDVDVPPGAKVLRAEGSVWWSAINANNAVTWRASTDGTTFQAGASDYFYGGFIHYAGSAGYANLVPSNEAFGRLSFPADTTTQPVRFRWLFPVVKSTNTNALHAGTVNAGYYNTPTTNAYTDAQFTSGVQSGANLAIKKLRFFNGPVGSVFGNGSVVICEWVY